VWYHLCLLFLVRPTGYIVNLSDFYSYRIIGKLTVFFHLQEFSHHNQIVDFRRVTFSAQLKVKVGSTLTKAIIGFLGLIINVFDNQTKSCV